MNDRTVRGGIAGSACGFIILFADLILHNVLRLMPSAWLGALSFLILGRDPRNASDLVIGIMGHLFFGGFLGAFYARFLMPEPASGSYILRGMGFGVLVWFATTASGTLFHVPRFLSVNPRATFFTVALALIWGFVFGAVMQRWDKSIVRQLTGGVGEWGAQLGAGAGEGADAADQGVHVPLRRPEGLNGDQTGGNAEQLAGLTNQLKQLNSLLENFSVRFDGEKRRVRDESEDGWWENTEERDKDGSILRPLDPDRR